MQRAQQSQTQDSFWRGILQRPSPRSRPAGYVLEALNVSFRGGTPEGRPGLRPYHGAPFSEHVRGMGFHVDHNGHPVLLVACQDGKVQRCVEGGDPETLALTNLPTTEQTRVEPDRVSFLSLSGGLITTFIYDGINTNLKYGGQDPADSTKDDLLTKMGLPQAPNVATPSTAGAGVSNVGTHLFLMTLNSPHHEGEPGNFESRREVTIALAAFADLTFPSPVQGVDFDDPQVTTWKLYGTTAGGGTFFFVNEADIGVDIHFNVTDLVLGVRNPVEQFVNNAPPAPAVCMAEHRGQLAAVFSDDLNLVRFSYMDQDFMVPEGWPEDYVQPVAHGDGDRITALASLQEWLVVFKQQGAFGITGDSFDDYKVVPVLSAGGGKHVGLGTNAPGCVLQVENMVMFSSRDGIYKISRFASASGGIEPERLSGAIDALYAAVRFGLGSACVFDRNHRQFIFFGHG